MTTIQEIKDFMVLMDADVMNELIREVKRLRSEKIMEETEKRITEKVEKFKNKEKSKTK